MCTYRKSQLFAARAGYVAASCLALFAAQLSCPEPAAAYCRANIETMANGTCVEVPGVPRLHWLRSCSRYTFNEAIFERIPKLDEAGVRAAFDDSFGAWRDVDCGRERFFVEQDEELTSDDSADFAWNVHNESVITLHTQQEWIDLEYSDDVVALTTLFHDPDTGEIFDADMELNGGAGEFSTCSRRCDLGVIDLRNTVTHEAGHYLGLGHSAVPGATMAPYAFDGREVEKASLAQDDREGYCALELPEHACGSGGCVCREAPIYSSTPGAVTNSNEGCQAVSAAGAAQNWVIPFALIAFWVANGRRRRRA